MIFSRPGAEWTRWIMVGAVLAMVLGVGLYTNLTLLSVERTLPTTLLAQLEDLTRMMEGLTELTASSDLIRKNPDPESIANLVSQIDDVFTELIALRNTYVFDNLVQASAFHSVVAPALVDARQWLTHGVSGHAPDSAVSMTIVHSRLHNALHKASHVRYDSHASAQAILKEQRERLERFLTSVNLLLLLTVLISLMVLGLIVRQHRLLRRETMARAERERLIAILESTNDLVSTSTPDSRLTYLNRSGRRLAGWMEDMDLALKRIRDLHPRWALEIIQDIGIPTAVQEGFWSGETALLRQDGTEVPVLQTIMSHKTTDGRVEYLSTIIRDISERKYAEQEREKLQAQLLQAQKMEAVGTLAGGVAHDFNNLLQAISGYTQMLLKDKEPSGIDHVRLKAIERSVDRAAQLVRRLLLFSRRANAQRIPTNLNQEVLDAATILEQTIPRMIRVTTHLESRLWPINADPVQMEQMLLNLGSNASDAMPEGGQLVLETQNIVLDADSARTHMGLQPGPHVLLIVSDTGCGMDKNTLEKIYDPFFTTKEMGKGTGLGMASVYGIVQDHGGAIMSYSESGQGTTFKIYLPAMPGREIEAAKEQPAINARNSGTETILIVDDETDLRELTAEALQSVGYSTIEAKNGEEALVIYDQNQARIALVILDLNMPGMGGHRCLKELLHMNPAVMVLIASGCSLTDQVRKTLDSGAAGFLGKPFQINELLAQVRQILDR